MSKHHRQGKVPGISMNPRNGDTPFTIPQDLEWPCKIMGCSGNLEHTDACDGNCEVWEPTENQVKLQNIRHEFMRHGLNADNVGTIATLTELYLRLQAAEKLLLDHLEISHDDYDEMYRSEKIEFLEGFLHNHLEEVKRQRTANTLGIIEKPGLLGPDGQPLG